MNIHVTASGVMVSSFVDRPVLSKPVQASRPWTNPGDVILNLLDQARAMAESGRTVQAAELEARAEWMFELLPS